MQGANSKIPLWVLWLLKKRTIVFSVFFSLIALAIIGYKAQGYFQGRAEAIVAVQAKLFENWAKQPKLDDNYSKLKELLSTNPVFQKKYETAIAEALIMGGFTTEGYSYLEKSLERAKQKIFPFAQFSTISYLIAQKQYEKALQESYLLKDHIMADRFFSKNGPASLLAINQLRITMLEKELKNKEKEKVALTELEGYFKTEKNPSLTTRDNRRFLDLFNTDSENRLKQYIANQKAAIR